MGTRGLTVVIFDGAYRIAQYGQWDHYPSGQGLTVLEFCRWLTAKRDRESVFLSNLCACRWSTPADEAAAKSAGRDWQAMFPLWTRDHGAKILSLIAEPPAGCDLVLQDQYEFAADSLCEWAYVVDLDARALEVYEGFNTRPAVGRFAAVQIADAGGRARNAELAEPYTPVTLVASFDLDKLPSKSSFLKAVDAATAKEAP